MRPVAGNVDSPLINHPLFNAVQKMPLADSAANPQAVAAAEPERAVPQGIPGVQHPNVAVPQGNLPAAQHPVVHAPQGIAPGAQHPAAPAAPRVAPVANQPPPERRTKFTPAAELVSAARFTEAPKCTSFTGPHKILYIKTHKTGSSTLANIFNRLTVKYGMASVISWVKRGGEGWIGRDKRGWIFAVLYSLYLDHVFMSCLTANRLCIVVFVQSRCVFFLCFLLFLCLFFCFFSFLCLFFSFYVLVCLISLVSILRYSLFSQSHRLTVACLALVHAQTLFSTMYTVLQAVIVGV